MKLGLALTLTTAACWGVLPIALKLALQGMDSVTITWYRFTVAALVLGTILAVTGGLPTLHSLSRRIWLLLALATAGLTGNYVLYLVALSHTTPSVAQIVIQLAPVFLLLGGLIVFRERFSARQWAGFALLMLGLALFFNRRLPEVLTGISDLPAPDGPFIRPKAAECTKFCSAYNRPAPEAVTSAHADVEPTGAAAFRAFLRHRSTLVPFLRRPSLHSAARQPAGTGSAQILRSISPKSRRFR